ncbi:MAG: hypothetical protein ISR76_01635 [Planctomycetes bacterium]|nr:hypothetical protein [Planctomycetota bacterium]MBL7007671.1 hypothetical protein [Planctomycetota bacterium]
MTFTDFLEDHPDASQDIQSWLSENRALTSSAIHAYYRSFREEWGIGPDTTAASFLDHLLAEGSLTEVQVQSEGNYSPFRRCVTNEASPIDLALSLRARSFLSHSTAVFAHGLTDRLPRTIYVNAEQSKKPKPVGSLTQEALDKAFRAKQRISRFVFIYQQYRIVILSGKHTGRQGVEEMTVAPGGARHAVSNLERTLIEITVRPAYGGGVQEVLKAYRSAASRCSVPKLLSMLRHFDYVYPYHQAIGFYLERAGVASEKLRPLRQLGRQWDFYLAHGMKDPEHDSDWRLFFPKGL